jgi:hypothetical protein
MDTELSDLQIIHSLQGLLCKPAGSVYITLLQTNEKHGPHTYLTIMCTCGCWGLVVVCVHDYQGLVLDVI